MSPSNLLKRTQPAVSIIEVGVTGTKIDPIY